MLDKNNKRMLAYIEQVTDVTPIKNADRLEAVHINGWVCVCGKGEFRKGDLGVFFEIDSKLPDVKPFNEMEFLVKKHFKIKTQKIRGTVSAGLFMPLSAFEGLFEIPAELHTDCTELLGITYSVVEDNKRKSKSVDKYQKMAQRNGKLFSKQLFRWLMKRTWGKKVLFIFFGKKRDNRTWPQWVVKTDEERVQNMPWILEDKTPWVATEKVDGTSTTFTIKRNKYFKHKYEFYVCSRNVVFDKPDRQCFYDTNVYLEMAKEYNIEEKLRYIMDLNPEYEWVTLQGETYGDGIQKRDYSLGKIHEKNPSISGHAFMGFNFITSTEGRWDSLRAEKYMNKFCIPWVPIVDTNFVMPDTVEELLNIATGESVLDGGMREGLVFRSQDGSKSFKAVSNEFLLRFHS